MKLKLDITPDLVAMMAAEIKAGEGDRRGWSGDRRCRWG